MGEKERLAGGSQGLKKTWRKTGPCVSMLKFTFRGSHGIASGTGKNRLFNNLKSISGEKLGGYFDCTLTLPRLHTKVIP